MEGLIDGETGPRKSGIGALIAGLFFQRSWHFQYEITSVESAYGLQLHL